MYISIYIQLGPTPEQMRRTKNEVKKVLLELLEDPDFRHIDSAYIYIYSRAAGGPRLQARAHFIVCI